MSAFREASSFNKWSKSEKGKRGITVKGILHQTMMNTEIPGVFHQA